MIADSILTVDLNALASNYRALADKAAPAETAGVVKANGYGLGAVPVARRLWAEGCRTFFVAQLSEALEIRAALPDAVIYAFNGRRAETDRIFAENSLRPVLNSFDDLADWKSFLPMWQKPPAAINLDTGMSRLGLSRSEADRLTADLQILEGMNISLLMSHLSAADEPEHLLNREQLMRFARMRARLPGVKASLAATGGILLGPQFHFDMCRAGIGLYGGTPFSDAAPVITLSARILQIREIANGDPVGYGGSFIAKRPIRVATVAMGYADGYLRAASNRAWAGIAGFQAPIIGRVSMDLITLDITEIPESGAHVGALVEMIGPNAGLDTIAGLAGTIGHEFLTRMGSRMERRYIGNEPA